jgi:predicted membrane protein
MSDRRHDADTEHCRRHHHGHHGLGTAIVGLGLLGLGVTLTLDNLGLVDKHAIEPYWPVLLILLGVSHLLQEHWFGGAVWSFVGAALLAANLNLVSFHVWELWPLLLVLFGGRMIWAVARGRRRVVEDSADTFHATAVLGGVSRRITAAEFAGGSAFALMGGCEVDLTGCAPAGAPAEISAFAMWGGVEIKVPEDWEVRVKGTALLGGFEDNTHPSVEGSGRKVLVVSGMAIMGGVEVKN